MRHEPGRCTAAAAALLSAAWVASVSCAHTVAIGTSAAIAAAECRMPDADRAWMRAAFEGWGKVTSRLALPGDELPEIVAFDQRCEYRLARGAPATALAGHAHGSWVTLPDGSTLQPRALSITSIGRDSMPFVAIALRSLWIAADSTADRGSELDRFLTRALVHELTHSQQLPSLTATLAHARLELRLDTLGDDVIQERFAGVTGFERQVDDEIDQLYRAILSTNPQERRRLLSQVVSSIRDRRAKYFAGALSPWGEVEQAFLDLEGAAEWAALFNARITANRSMSGAEILRRFRLNGHYWSEQEGLGLYLALDAISHDWPLQTFASHPMSSLEQLEQALASGRPVRMQSAMNR